MTAVARNAFTAAQYNANVRDNLLETMPAKATAAGRYFASTGSKAIAERVPTAAVVLTAQTRASTSYGDLTTVGPAVTVTTGAFALVWIQCTMSNSADGLQCLASVAVSGATTIAAQDEYAIELNGVPANNSNRFGVCRRFSLTAGSNMFTMKYAAGGTGTFSQREIVVMPL
jgi:hypothetical protein